MTKEAELKKLVGHEDGEILVSKEGVSEQVVYDYEKGVFVGWHKVNTTIKEVKGKK